MAAAALTGDFKILDDWIDILETAGDDMMEFVQQSMAEEFLALIDEGFQKERDPYGRRWPKKQRYDGRKVLHGPTRRLRSGWHIVNADRDSFEVWPSVDYAAPHQDPRKNRRPKRAMVPDERGLPRKWEERMRRVTLKVMSAYFGENVRSARELRARIR